MKETITIVPGGGLANRLRAIDSAYQLSLEHNKRLRVIWIKNKDFACEFNRLFELPSQFNIRKFNYFQFFAYPNYLQNKIPLGKIIAQTDRRMRFDRIILNEEIHHIIYNKKRKVEIENTYTKLFMDTCERIRKESMLAELFVPTTFIKSQVKNVTMKFNKHTIGIHIRRTDNTNSISQSPLELFESFIEKCLTLNPKSNFFLATDSEEVKITLLSKFGEYIHTVNHGLGRNSETGMQNGLIDFLCLSETIKVVGSSGSSFTSEAANFSGIPVEILKKKN